jgi:hypothetical protein
VLGCPIQTRGDQIGKRVEVTGRGTSDDDHVVFGSIGRGPIRFRSNALLVEAFKVGSATVIVLARSITKGPPCLSLLVISDWIYAYNVMMLDRVFPSINRKIGPGYLWRSVVLNDTSVGSSIVVVVVVGCGSPHVLHIDFGIKVKLFVPFQFFHTRGYAGVIGCGNVDIVVVAVAVVVVNIVWSIRFTGTWETFEMEVVAVVVDVVVDCTGCCDGTVTFVSTFLERLVLATIVVIVIVVVVVVMVIVVFAYCRSVISVDGVHDRCLHGCQRVGG